MLACSLYLSLLIFSALTFLGPPAFAQSEEEMDILRMYYKEKDLVVSSATRYPKPISQAAENITVVTANEIEMMNAHTVAEVLNRIPGFFVVSNQDFGASSILQIQGSEDRHVLVLVDGVEWNFMAGGTAVTNSIPVGIIERIEVIKGPASSAWGSSLGGVVNIITKDAGTDKKPSGSVQASYGKKDCQDYRAEAAGMAGPVGYYLSAGSQDSDGLKSSRDFDTYNLYSKMRIPIAEKVTAGLSVGYSQPDMGYGDYIMYDFTSEGMERAFFTTGTLNAALNSEVNFELSLYHFRQKHALVGESLGLTGNNGPKGEVLDQQIVDEETTGASSKLIWTHGIHTALLGADIHEGDLDQERYIPNFFQLRTHPELRKRSVFVNDTIVIDRFSIIPGARYDYDSVTGSFLSPSLGATYKISENSLVRGSVARGFNSPPLSFTSGGGFFLDPNPALDSEEVWSYQVGAESTALRYLWIKGTIFRHEIDDTITLDYRGPANNDQYINKGEITRQGFELEAQTAPWHDLSFLAGYCYVDLDPTSESGSSNIYSYSFGVEYDGVETLKAELFGRYVWWDLDDDFGARYDDFIWDLNLIKNIWSRQTNAVDIFATIHNLFDGAHYVKGWDRNPGTWAEAGIRIKF
ncbi:conserved exported hypothetical protein [uncultured Desulfobacterium sp.]|uniref:TonB-dependent receptor n=1 Tax=uncultured Desulfobacterium sp. TaxID=201089 RepID=A0A445MRU9_9BACT|nr:conserved exported hypothetical protein [uncultured Desulfobacterium sp.]